MTIAHEVLGRYCGMPVTLETVGRELEKQRKLR